MTEWATATTRLRALRARADDAERDRQAAEEQIGPLYDGARRARHAVYLEAAGLMFAGAASAREIARALGTDLDNITHCLNVAQEIGRAVEEQFLELLR